MTKSKKPTPKTLSLALQGGGAHGAYTWGVLDRLLEEEDITIEAISGTSAGAMNGAALINGYVLGGRQGAREKLAEFWQKISDNAGNPINTVAVEQMLGQWHISLLPIYQMVDMWLHLVSPYDSNPLNVNPLREILHDVLDLDALHACSDIKLFVAATNVKTGLARIFNCEQMSIDVLLASACLPQLFQAVQIDNDYYWDGGYMGNPAIHPLIYKCHTEDIMLVQINPIFRDKVPKLPIEITNRINEINFNSSLIAEMRAIDFVKRLIKQGKLSDAEYKNLRIHRVYDSEFFAQMNASTKFIPSMEFFKNLRDIGRKSCEEWLKKHKKDIAVNCTVDIQKTFLHGLDMYE